MLIRTGSGRPGKRRRLTNTTISDDDSSDCASDAGSDAGFLSGSDADSDRPNYIKHHGHFLAKSMYDLIEISKVEVADLDACIQDQQPGKLAELVHKNLSRISQTPVPQRRQPSRKAREPPSSAAKKRSTREESVELGEERQGPEREGSLGSTIAVGPRQPLRRPAAD